MNVIPTLTPLAMPCNSSFEAKDWEILSSHWYPVARIQDVSTAPQRVKLLDVNMALYKTESGEIHSGSRYLPTSWRAFNQRLGRW